MKYKIFFLLIGMTLLSAIALAVSSTLESSSLPYYIDPHHNLWLKVDLNGNTQHFKVYNKPGYSPNGEQSCGHTITLAQAA